ncbi:hypothetical protein NJ7G_0933 [Natrinema sp. J7-2]|nr:hypothetical protein NJ7G_0933 [Natrinema sp. J7-2]
MGSKRERYVAQLEVSGTLQTDPCGVEAITPNVNWTRSRWLQTDPCGVEAVCGYCGAQAELALQTDPCGVEAAVASPRMCNDAIVTDGPLWGRSYEQDDEQDDE